MLLVVIMDVELDELIGMMMYVISVAISVVMMGVMKDVISVVISVVMINMVMLVIVE